MTTAATTAAREYRTLRGGRDQPNRAARHGAACMTTGGAGVNPPNDAFGALSAVNDAFSA